MSPCLYIFDDEVARSWEPFSLTRPAGELLFGALLLRERAERYWGAPCKGHLSAPGLAEFSEPGAPPALDGAAAPSAHLRIFQSSRAVLSPPAPPLHPREKATLFLGGEVVGWMVPPGEPPPPPDLFLRPGPLAGSTTVDLTGRTLAAVWDIMERNADQLAEDLPRYFPGYAVNELPGSHILGDGLLSVGAGVTLEPGSVFDVSKGPIRLSDGVVVRSHTRLEGPAFVGPGSIILGGVVSSVSIGPLCKIRGKWNPASSWATPTRPMMDSWATRAWDAG
jgi:UDP-N-acetylglucosamine diphosphorylase / glucose-1-phosphate thymidylyltransferase / UDP-N-acetylgalactosamine diphosphorylase / glucosamine-1-phosphate N-acetyltransferase / galactosamine-1-phosphate N-acetyltransferase